ncbi:DNA mismatch repair protein MutS [Verticiella sediminum]|uniref:DNA mismatch repair protein MutS n=1 Tax=Verticiella sediminum TaxID=1247510 RepID=A0A556AC49_9BURK|nr:Smr/MutS family protein [Verticiella sediminum]TSH90447.1 DNA mismatch repair protein MutS [Verticiella sediminum]
MKKRRKPAATAAPAGHAPPPPLNAAFAGLKGMQRELQTRRRAEAEAAARQRHDEARREREADMFRRAVGRVTPLKPNGRAERSLVPPPALPLQRWADDDAVLRESVSDEYGAEWLLESDETLSHRRAGLGPDVVRRLRRGHWTVSAQIDLHGLRVDEARDALGEFLRACVRREQRCVRIIHGKGLGSVNRTPVLKEKVRRWLTQKDEVLAFVEARPNDGGAGVVLALLKASP